MLTRWTSEQEHRTVAPPEQRKERERVIGVWVRLTYNRSDAVVAWARKSRRQRFAVLSCVRSSRDDADVEHGDRGLLLRNDGQQRADISGSVRLPLE